jgi:mRNA-degrading endonuclease HigB of HigAB toxin-antitoxin module
MIVVGASELADYGNRHARMWPALRALNEALRQAAWTDRAGIERDCGTIARFGRDRHVVLELAEARCRVALRVNYALGVVRITSISEMKETRGK